jgi:hypothetical protein
MEDKVKSKQLEKNREQLIRERTPIHSKVPSELFYEHYDGTFNNDYNHVNLACCECINCRLRRIKEERK